MLCAMATVIVTAAATEQPQKFCRFTQEGGTWWLTCPGAGLQRTLSMGVNHVENSDPNVTVYRDCPAGTFGPPRYSHMLQREICPWFFDSYDTELNVSMYALSTLARYGNSSAWAASAAQRLASWNFNTVGCWSSPLLTGEPAHSLAQPAVSPSGLLYGYPMGMLMSGYETRFVHDALVDVFDQAFVLQCTRLAQEQAAPRRNDTRLLGYWLDNERDYNPDYRGGHDLLGSSLRSWSGASQQRVIAWLAERYNQSVPAFNLAWNVTITSWQQLATQQCHGCAQSIHRLARITDNDAFVFHYVRAYFRPPLHYFPLQYVSFGGDVSLTGGHVPGHCHGRPTCRRPQPPNLRSSNEQIRWPVLSNDHASVRKAPGRGGRPLLRSGTMRRAAAPYPQPD
jgi:hypothetical protein